MSAEVAGLCSVREWGLGEALEAYQALFTASFTGSGGRGGGRDLLRLAAIENVIAERMRLHATIDIHRALLAGVPAAEVAHVLGVEIGQLAGRWRRWADGQLHLHSVFPALGVGHEEYEKAAEMLADEVLADEVLADEGAGPGRDDLDRFTTCPCPGTKGQIGSPRP